MKVATVALLVLSMLVPAYAAAPQVEKAQGFSIEAPTKLVHTTEAGKDSNGGPTTVDSFASDGGTDVILIQVTTYSFQLNADKATLEYLIGTLKTDHSDIVVYGVSRVDGELSISGMYFLRGAKDVDGGHDAAYVSDVMFTTKGNRLYYLLYHPESNVPKMGGAGDKFLKSFRFVDGN